MSYNATTQWNAAKSTLLLGVAIAPHDIGQRIKAARGRKHWTQQEFALKASVSIGTISRWETGKLPPVRELIRIADVLGIEPEELVEPALGPSDEVSDRLLAVEAGLSRSEALLERIAKALDA